MSFGMEVALLIQLLPGGIAQFPHQPKTPTWLWINSSSSLVLLFPKQELDSIELLCLVALGGKSF